MRAILIEQPAEGGIRADVTDVDPDRLPESGPAGVTVAVEHSTVNYKDGLAITAGAPVVRRFPMIPGIDFAGRVIDSAHPSWRPGDAVILNGWGVGESHWGGLAERARVAGDWLVRLPEALDTRQAMAIGTAGYTAMLCVMALERHGVRPDAGEVLVTGATGGVGSFAVLLLSRLGYRVVASTGKQDEAAYLKQLGAVDVLDRAAFSAPGKPLAKERWAAAVDSVGGHTLANVCAAIRYGGAVAACGLAGGMALPATVAPFILRGIALLGVDSVMAAPALRAEAWRRLAAQVDPVALDGVARTVGLSGAIDAAHDIVAGRIRGRVVVDVAA